MMAQKSAFRTLAAMTCHVGIPAIMRGGVVSRPAAEVCHVFMAGHNYMPAMGMAGHSKWHNIRHKKGAEDAKRSIIFAKVAMQVRAAMEHGGNSPTNGQLSNVLKKAKELKVPKDIIDRAIKKAEEAKAGGMVSFMSRNSPASTARHECKNMRL